ncbi:hypothetical protein [Bacillus sp. IBL03825]|uniref:hypothetical protein n=1 Tax=Bacillus sp. IBL03825 TaxID=2953580 RepID=UPI002157C634|nr:hypothetical protein [Bacillus sp. IBL03825]MCR6850440.1 hypothetical protein [Bacillus sp. IBL03825]
MTHFNKELCIYVVSELNLEVAICKAKRRININKERVNLWIKATNAQCGALNDEIIRL